ncbi:MAG: hypothetical protein HY714_02895 [Candidatus Omnitrophica bacterium]|nr:hypothetical protein [Candidatus Omnitrophota bacterium]
MLKKILTASFCILILANPALAVDVLDVFKFNRPTELKLQPEGPRYDPAFSHGVVSPFTAYVGNVVTQLIRARGLADFRDWNLPPLREGQMVTRFMDPKQAAAIGDKVLRRNYVGIQELFVVPGDIESLFQIATDYDHLEKLLPGMEESLVLEKKGNRVQVENWRKADASVFGKRKSYYVTTNILWSSESGDRRLIKSQLMRGDEKKAKHQGMLFLDSVWYFESCGPECTRVFYLGFTLMRWDYLRTPAFFPFVAKEVRRQVVNGVVEGAAKSSLAVLAKFSDPALRAKPLADLTKNDKKSITRDVEARLKRMQKTGKIQIDWDRVFE